jgi:dTDP-4-amino-4,6-dideoxygalactose transaminase
VIRRETGLRIPFNRPYMTGKELEYIAQAHADQHLAGDGAFTRKCQAWLDAATATRKALLTTSCTSALEMTAILANVGPGDEVIMPSYTFSSTANAFVLRGAIPVFVDIREDTLNLDETLLRQAITSRTRAIAVVHYAGVACEMDAIMAIAEEHGLIVIEDAAQGVMASYRGRALGGIGHLGAMSFHETKNLSSGEGGALLVNDERFSDRAEILWEKGTNRSQFFRGQVDKYTWVDVGSSFLPTELVAAFLWAQMEVAESITARRLALWDTYHGAFEQLEREGHVRRPRVPAHCTHNAHMYYLLLPSLDRRTALIDALARQDVNAVFHYVPLHSSPAGKQFGRATGPMSVTDAVSDRLVRLPMWLGLEEHQGRVCEAVVAALRQPDLAA